MVALVTKHSVLVLALISCSLGPVMPQADDGVFLCITIGC